MHNNLDVSTFKSRTQYISKQPALLSKYVELRAPNLEVATPILDTATTADTATMSLSIPILSIPLYYILAQVPHGYASSFAMKGGSQNYDNRNPKGSNHQESLKKRLGPREYAAYERAENCHRNGLENMPLFVATIFAGMLAEQKAGSGAVGLTTFCVAFLAMRVGYTANYIVVDTMNWSYVRSLLYVASTIWAFYVCGRAAMVLST